MPVPRGWIACGWRAQLTPSPCRFRPESGRWNPKVTPCRLGGAPYAALPRSRLCPQTWSHDRFPLARRRFRFPGGLRRVVGMENALPKIVGLHVVQRQSVVLKRYAICINGFPVWIQDNDALRNGIGHEPKFFFILTELSFGALKIIDVRIRSIPVDNVAGLVAKWLSPEQEPSVHSIKSTQSTLAFAGAASGQIREPCICYLLQVFRVNGILPSPAANHFKRQACIFLPALVPKYSRTIRQGTPGECRDRVDDFPKSRFRVADLLKGAPQCFLRSLSLDGDYGDVTRAFD